MENENNLINDNELIMNWRSKRFSQFVTDRTSDIWTRIHCRSQELKDLENKQNEVYEKLKKNLNKEEKDILEEYNEWMNLYVAYLRQVIYELGFKDGIKLTRETDEDIINMNPIFK